MSAEQDAGKSGKKLFACRDWVPSFCLAVAILPVLVNAE